MTNKSNIEIIIEETENFADKVSDLYEQEFSNEDYSAEFDNLVNKFATTLLSKLNRLDRLGVEEVVAKKLPLTPNFIRQEIADQILQLIPKEGEVIAEGEVVYKGTELMGTIGKDFMDSIMHKLNGKRGKLIFIEDREEVEK